MSAFLVAIVGALVAIPGLWLVHRWSHRRWLLQRTLDVCGAGVAMTDRVVVELESFSKSKPLSVHFEGEELIPLLCSFKVEFYLRRLNVEVNTLRQEVNNVGFLIKYNNMTEIEIKEYEHQKVENARSRALQYCKRLRYSFITEVRGEGFFKDISKKYNYTKYKVEYWFENRWTMRINKKPIYLIHRLPDNYDMRSALRARMQRR